MGIRREGMKKDLNGLEMRKYRILLLLENIDNENFIIKN